MLASVAGSADSLTMERRVLEAASGLSNDLISSRFYKRFDGLLDDDSLGLANVSSALGADVATG